MKPAALQPLVTAAGAAVILLSLVLLSSNSTTASHDPGNPQFVPTVDYKLCNDLPSDFVGPAPLQGGGGACAENSDQGATPDLSFDFDLPAGHLNFSPDALILTLSDEFTIAPDIDILDGSVAGGVSGSFSLALSSSSCDTDVFAEFILYDATADIGNLLVIQESTLIAFDGEDAYDDKADGTSPAIARYPDFNNRLFDPDGSGDSSGGFSPVQPHARYAGLTDVSSGGWSLLQIFIFQPGTLKAAFSANPDSSIHPFSRLDASLGWISIVTINDPLAAGGAPSSVTDFCSPLTLVGALLGRVDTDGDTVADTDRLVSPASVGGIDGEGTQLAQAYLLSLRDVAEDGIENALDTCPFAANVEDPYTSAGQDSDGLDSACDPYPSEFNPDEDGDGFLNTQDNCPLASNPTQTESELSIARNAAAPDGGPWRDQLGDACDSEQGGNDLASDGLFFHAFTSDAFCINDTPGADGDSDGWCSVSAGADPDDGDPNVTGEDDQDADAHLFSGQPGHDYENWKEIYMQTDPLADCPEVAGSHDAWPPDFNMSKTVNILDVGAMRAVFNLSEGDPGFDRRYDLNADGAINVLDFGLLSDPFNTSCTPP